MSLNWKGTFDEAKQMAMFMKNVSTLGAVLFDFAAWSRTVQSRRLAQRAATSTLGSEVLW
jgi:hypothetical protein